MGWNDFEYNMAAGAGSCGSPSPTAALRLRQRGLQDLPGLRDYNVGTSPLELRWNSCSTAMFSFMEVGNPDSGVGNCDMVMVSSLFSSM